MYPERELTLLAARKRAVRQRIAVRRAACVQAAARLARPLAWLDRVRTFWHRLSPLARIVSAPLGLLASRAVLPRGGILGALARWAPLAFGVGRAAAFIRRPSAAGKRPSG